MMRGRPLKTHPQWGGGYPTQEDFCAVYGLNLRFGFWMPFCTGMLSEDTHNTSDNTHIYAFCLHWCAHPSVCLCSFSVYNVRARANVNSS